jgi:acetylglutamate kinase
VSKNRMNLFVKVSGDLCLKESFLAYLRTITRDYFTVICVGGGTQINETLLKRGIQPGPHGPMGRELNSFKLRQVARDVLEENQSRLQDKLADLGIVAVVIIPVLDLGSVLCHVNGDEMVRTAYIGFDHLVVITTKDRVEKKAGEFFGLNKVEVIAME